MTTFKPSPNNVADIPAPEDVAADLKVCPCFKPLPQRPREALLWESQTQPVFDKIEAACVSFQNHRCCGSPPATPLSDAKPSYEETRDAFQTPDHQDHSDLSPCEASGSWEQEVIAGAPTRLTEDFGFHSVFRPISSPRFDRNEERPLDCLMLPDLDSKEAIEDEEMWERRHATLRIAFRPIVEAPTAPSRLLLQPRPAIY